MLCFVYFDLEMRFPLRRHAIFLFFFLLGTTRVRYGVQFFDIVILKSGPNLVYFAH